MSPILQSLQIYKLPMVQMRISILFHLLLYQTATVISSDRSVHSSLVGGIGCTPKLLWYKHPFPWPNLLLNTNTQVCDGQHACWHWCQVHFAQGLKAYSAYSAHFGVSSTCTTVLTQFPDSICDLQPNWHPLCWENQQYKLYCHSLLFESMKLAAIWRLTADFQIAWGCETRHLRM